MNRLILIGNGFDLAHNLKTSYKDFIEYLWKGIFMEMRQKMYQTNGQIINSSYADACFEFTDSNELIKLEYRGNKYHIGNNILYLKIFSKHKKSVEFEILLDKDDENKILLDNLKDLIGIYNENFYLYQNPNNGYRSDNYINKFFKIISQNYINKNWSDIEADYYRELLSVKDNQADINELNRQFNQIKKLLREYLEDQEQPKKIDKLENIIYEPIKIKDIKLGQLGSLGNTSNEIIKKYFKENVYRKEKMSIDLQKKGFYYDTSKIEGYDKDKDEYFFIKYVSECLLKMKNIEGLEPFYLPKSILLLNFNYTKTEGLYINNPPKNYVLDENVNIQVNHIHGSLDDSSNHMIFGYGDEEADEYKELEKSDNRGLLDNVKSINYLEASNYRDMERFIESDKYQIFIMGMSCGMADRTMLRKLFQHDNCVSVKPFFYQWKDDEGNIAGDNYTEIVQNISRCFSDKDLLRSVVVDKLNCKPLPQWNDKCERERIVI